MARMRGTRGPKLLTMWTTATALLVAGCGSRQTGSEVVIRSTSETRISTARIESNEGWSSTYGSPRPKLQHVLSLGTTDLPASSAGSSASGASPSDSTAQVVVHVDNHTTQTNVIVVPARSYVPVRHRVDNPRLNPGTKAARMKSQSTKIRPAHTPKPSNDEPARKESMQPRGHVPLPVSTPDHRPQ